MPFMHVIGVAEGLCRLIHYITDNIKAKKGNPALVEELGLLLGLLSDVHDKLQSSSMQSGGQQRMSALSLLDSDLKHVRDRLEKCFGANVKGPNSWFDIAWNSLNAASIQKELQEMRMQLRHSFMTAGLVIVLDNGEAGHQQNKELMQCILDVRAEQLDMMSSHSQQMADLQTMMQQLLGKSCTSQQGSSRSPLHDCCTDAYGLQPGADDALDQVLQHMYQQHAQMLQDPLHDALMCDPVMCSDGLTYDRWSAIELRDSSCSASPSNGSQPGFSILCEDVHLREVLFKRHEQQRAECVRRRAEYRERALKAAQDGQRATAERMLADVLQWAPWDVQCSQLYVSMAAQASHGRASGRSTPAGAVRTPLDKPMDHIHLPDVRNMYLSPQDLEISDERLSNGSYGRVVKGKLRGEEVSIKLICEGQLHHHNNIDSLLQDSAVCAFLLEVAVLSRATARCQHTCQWHGFSVKGSTLALVMPLYHGTLADLVSLGGMDLEEVLTMALAVAKGMAELHSLGIVVANLKPDNVLFNHMGDPVLGDFGISHIASTALHGYHTSAQGVFEYMAPEQFDNDQMTSSADIWAWACLVHHLLTGTAPWTGMQTRDIYRKVVKESRFPPMPDGVPSRVADLLQECFSKRPQGRPTAIDVVQRCQMALKEVQAIFMPSSNSMCNSDLERDTSPHAIQGAFADAPQVEAANPQSQGQPNACPTSIRRQRCMEHVSSNSFGIPCDILVDEVVEANAVVEISITDVELHGVAMDALLDMYRQAPLRSMSLINCSLTDEGAKLLAQHGGAWQHMKTLRLNSNEISDVGASALVQHQDSSWPGLQELDLRGNHMSQDVSAVLMAIMPCMRV